MRGCWLISIASTTNHRRYLSRRVVAPARPGHLLDCLWMEYRLCRVLATWSRLGVRATPCPNLAAKLPSEVIIQMSLPCLCSYVVVRSET